ncbi:hypothetical protein CTAYLR_003119 [Chrysophaeum taylorii]|uniref:Diphthine--ammonia ligase n=1 Tax=Chrysophaeum taylorii TaxID=2483200 RepID=A0AAD7XRR0_9STRA|nr:hypothetical protein CTAYLR_003119 [Chrysophaeum taylorii]
MVDIEETHEAACRSGLSHYLEGDRVVFTRVGLLARGKCCGAGCRHCPYESVPAADPSFLVDTCVSPATVLFFSGGKDSFLALRKLQRQGRNVILLTTFDGNSRTIAHQEVDVEKVVRQATALGVGLVGVPLQRADGEGYVSRIRRGLECVRRRGVDVMALAFGDLHLADIKAWRDKDLAVLGLPLEYPIFHDTPGR